MAAIALSDERNAIKRRPASISFDPVTTAAAYTLTF
jgi:hypothetical protein